MREAVKAWCREEGLSAWDRRSQTGLLRNLVVREGRRTGQLQARLVTSPGATFRVAELAAATPAETVPLDPRRGRRRDHPRRARRRSIKGNAYLEEELSGLRFRISPDAFFQTNTEMAERLYGAAAELAGLTGRERVVDLFCGIGTIALALALDAGEVWGVEIVGGGRGRRDRERQAQRDRQHELLRRRRAPGDAAAARAARASPDVVVVDPPRAGLSQKVVRRMLEAEAERIVYVSCNPTTLAPNARQMADAGYELKTVRPVDMFPQTPHIESVALLERG